MAASASSRPGDEALVKRSPSRLSPWRDLLGLVWKVPLFALPFALFFLITSGQPLSTFSQFYVVSLVFAASSLTGVWLAHHWLVPPMAARNPDDPRLALKASAVHAATSLLFGAAGAVLLHFTLFPSFLGSGSA